MNATVITRHSTMGEVLAFVAHAEQIDGSLGVSPGDVVAALGSDDPPRLLDVPFGGGASLRPLRSVVSEAQGCQGAGRVR